jgi:hypothetical protein
MARTLPDLKAIRERVLVLPMADDPSVRASLENWRNWDGPISEKIRLTLKNNLIKARRRSQCCGNHGEPGC